MTLKFNGGGKPDFANVITNGRLPLLSTHVPLKLIVELLVVAIFFVALQSYF